MQPGPASSGSRTDRPHVACCICGRGSDGRHRGGPGSAQARRRDRGTGGSLRGRSGTAHHHVAGTGRSGSSSARCRAPAGNVPLARAWRAGRRSMGRSAHRSRGPAVARERPRSAAAVSTSTLPARCCPGSPRRAPEPIGLGSGPRPPLPQAIGPGWQGALSGPCGPEIGVRRLPDACGVRVGVGLRRWRGDGCAAGTRRWRPRGRPRRRRWRCPGR